MPAKTIASEIEIEAARPALWQILSDLAGYGQWNPFIRKAEGTLAPGERLRLELHIPDGMKMKIRPRLLSVVAEQEIRWLGHLFVPGLFSGDHRFVLESVGAHRTRLYQEETFSGILVPVFGAWIAAGALRGFDAMNRAAKHRLERSDPAGIR